MSFLFFHYLNRGVWRICFILGLLLGLFCFALIKSDESNKFFYFRSFKNLEEVVKTYDYQFKRGYGNDVLKYIYEHYPFPYPSQMTSGFYPWIEGVNLIYHNEEYRHMMKKKCSEYDFDKNYPEGSYPYKCIMANNYMKQPIYVGFISWNYFLLILFLFYFPFFIACILTWICRGFKQSG